MVAWRDGGDPHLSEGRRYASRADAETEIKAWYAGVRARTPSAIVYAMESPELAIYDDDGDLVPVEDDE